MFHLFGGTDCYYASGGVNDYIDSYQDIEQARKAASDIRIKNKIDWDGPEDDDWAIRRLDWWQITDENMNIIEESKKDPYGSKAGPRSDIREIIRG